MKGQSELVKFFKENKGVLRFNRMLHAGFHPDVLGALVKNGTVGKISRGLYSLSDTKGTENDLVRVMLQDSRGIICLVSALSFYGVTDEIPRRVDIAIEKGMRAKKIRFPGVKYYHFGPKQWEAGVDEKEVEGYKIRIYSLAKTIADCFRFRNRIGMDTARAALKAAVNEKHIAPLEIYKYAKICRVSNIIKPVLEAII